MPDADPAAFVAAQVDEVPGSVLRDAPHRLVQLRTAVALAAGEHVTGEALAVHPDEDVAVEHVAVSGERSVDEREVGDAVEDRVKREAAERAPLVGRRVSATRLTSFSVARR